MDISTIADAQKQVRILRQILLVLTLIIAIYSYIAYASRVSDKIYTVIQSNHYCSRRLNATHQMGCTSELGGNQGILWIINNQSDLDHVLKSGPTPPYIAALTKDYYQLNYLLEFKKRPDRITGVVFLDINHNDSKHRLEPFSPDDVCPNRYSGLYVDDTRYAEFCNSKHWQRDSPISGLLFEDIPYPIFLINDQKSIDAIIACFNSNNIKDNKQDTYPLCGLHLDSFMLAASDSESCLNSHSLVDELLQSNGRRCDTVENLNIFAFYKKAVAKPKRIDGRGLIEPGMAESQSIVMLITKLSSLSMFTEISPGADSTITSVITLLTVAEYLGRVRDIDIISKSNRNIAFAILDSEPYDYTGSVKMVYSMMNHSFPNSFFKIKDQTPDEAIQNINLTSLDYVINLDQLAAYPSTDVIYFHQDPLNTDRKKLTKVIKIMKDIASKEKVKLELADPEYPLPPTSVHEFIKHSKSFDPENRLMGLVLSNYEKVFNNLFYNSIYDDSHNVYQNSKENLIKHIAQVSSLVAKSLFKLTFEEDIPNDVLVDQALVEQLFDCYLVNASCNLFTKVLQAGQQFPSGPIQTYKDPIKRSDDMNGAITTHLLAYFLGYKLKDKNLTQCYEINARSFTYNYQYINDKEEPVKDSVSGTCVQSQVQTVSSLSPAFQVTEDGIIIDKKYPAWTVSLNGIRNPVRLYLKSSPVYQVSIFLTGITITLMSFLAVHKISSNLYSLKIDSETFPGTST